MRCRTVFGVAGRRFVRRTTGWCRGIRGPGLALQSCSVGHEVRVELAGDVTFEDAHDLAYGSTFGETACDVFAGAFIAAHAGEHDAPQGMVGLAVPAGVQTVTVDFPRRRRQWCDAAQMREGASLFSRCGLSPAATSRIAAVLIPTP